MLMKDLITIPESVRKGDFVLRLTEGVDKEHADRTLAEYVVTPQLARCFDDALGLIKSAIESKSSKGTYLHGSFGCGKSHFMAVLHLLLQGNLKARSIPELAGAVSKHDSWLLKPGTTASKKCLLVPFNLQATKTLEQALFSRYVDYVGKLHPEAAIPGVYLAEEVFKDADKLRGLMGDEKFFQTLNVGAAAPGGGGGWGKRASGWTAESYQAAKAAGPRSLDRSRLVGTLVDNLLPSLRGVSQAASGGEAYINVDDGLSILSKHAQSLGYDALVLFLDELILWLAANASNPQFVSGEVQKLIKVVEPQNADRPVPIVSFIARQRDLREMVGTNLAGSQQLGFSDTLKYWEGRFGTITLEDRNLPAIAKRRILKPKDEAAKVQIDTAFSQTKTIREDLRTILLTKEADEQAFRDVYPFSPALVEALVAVSSVLQRERTALKVMVQLLVEQRETLELGQLVPVGDLYDLIAQGDEAVTEGMKRTFEQANRLYHQKLVPLLEAKHGPLEQVRTLPWTDPIRVALRADERVIKTVLLSALASGVESLKSLTPRKIAALNHGSFRAAIPGTEARDILRKLREWAGTVGELRIGDDPQDPTIGIELTGVDTQSILDAVQTEDTPGNRQAKVRELLYRAIGVEDAKGFFTEHTMLWRGSRRTFDISFGNIRDRDSLSDESFRSTGDQWRIVIDFPFDDANHTPNDDLARVNSLTGKLGRQRTVCWVPSFLTPRGQANIGLLVKLDFLLTQERLATFANHLSPQDRTTARLMLENQRSQVHAQVLADLDAAYGVVESARSDRIDHSHGLQDHFLSLQPGFTPTPPVAANLRAGFERILDQSLAYQYPAHPQFEAEIRPAHLRKVYGELQKAMQTENGRIVVDKELRKDVRLVVNELKLANMSEQALVMEQFWKTHFTRKFSEHAGAGRGAPTVRDVRPWLDEPLARGLAEEVQNLVILVAAEQAGRIFRQAGRLVTPSIDNLDDEFELHEQPLPNDAQWEEARRRAADIFGVAVPPLLSISNVTALGKLVQEQARAHSDSCVTLASRLKIKLPSFGLDATTSSSGTTAKATHTLAQDLGKASFDTAWLTLVEATLETSSAAMGTSLKSAAKVVSAIDACPWQLLDSLKQLKDDRHEAAEAIIASVRQAMASDELATRLEDALKSAAQQATSLLVRTPEPPPPPPGPPPPPPPPPPPGKVRRVVREDRLADMEPAQVREILSGLQREFEADPQLRLDIEYKIVRIEDASG